MATAPESDSLSFRDIALAPEAACLIGSALIREGSGDDAARMAAAIGAALFPGPKLEVLPGAFAGFWSGAFGSGEGRRILDAAWPGKSAPPLSSSAGRELLILAAKSKDAESLERLLSLKIARRSKSILLAAFEHGGWRMAERIKKPTEAEATEILQSFSGPAAEGREAESFRWALGFIESDFAYGLDSRWAFLAARNGGPAVAEAITENLPRLGLHRLGDSLGQALAASFLAAGAFSAAERTLEFFGVPWSRPFASDAATLSFYADEGSGSGRYPLQLSAPGLPIAAAALFSKDPDAVLAAARAGSPLPEEGDLAKIVGIERWASRTAQSILKEMPEIVSVLQAAALRGSLPQPKASAGRARKPGL